MKISKLWSVLTISLTISVSALMSPTASAWWSWCWWNCNYTKTQHPIVLAHGAFGFESILGMDYFYGIGDALEDGGATVYTTQVVGANSSVVRGEQLIAQLDEIRAIRGKPNLKFNLIGHSQGGHDIRYLAGVRPDLVASLTTIGSPHFGLSSNIYDIFGGEPLSVPQVFSDIVGVMLAALGANGEDFDINGLTAFLGSEDSVEAFNQAFPAGLPSTYCGEGAAVTATPYGNIRNYSWTGSGSLTNILDISDPLVGFLSLLQGEPSDGVIPVCSAHFGDVIRDNYNMNHADEVNLLFGLTALFETDPKTVFRQHANRLKRAGL